MELKDYQKIRLIVFLLVLVGVFLSIYFDLFLLILIFLGSGMAITTFFKTQIKDPLVDERIESIQEKAARTSFKILMPILGLTSLTLYYAGEGSFHFIRSLGIILGYVTLVGLLVYLISYLYFKRRYGG